MKIPHDVDDLLWEVAEKQTPELMDEFASRFPEYKGELVKRIKMVRQLKGAKPTQAAASKPFVPKSKPSVGLPSGWILAGAACGILLVGVASGIGMQRWLMSPVPPPITGSSRPSEDQNPQVAKQFPPPASDGAQLEQKTWLPQEPQPQQPVQTPQQLSAFDRKVTLDYDRALLSTVLEDMALKAGIRLQAAPGMPELEIEAKYFEIPVITVLNDLGRNFGFTPLKQTESEALLIPAIDPSASVAKTGDLDASLNGGESSPADTDSRPPSSSSPRQVLPPAKGLSGTIGR